LSRRRATSTTTSRRPAHRGLLAGLFAALLCGLPASTAAYESDQYSNRLQPLEDAEPQLDELVNQAVTEVAAGWDRPLDTVQQRWAFARRIYWRLGGLHWVDRIEAIAMRDPEVEKLPQWRRRSIFRGAPIWASRVNFVFGVGRTIRLADVLVGSDKLGHFFSQGLKYYATFLMGAGEAAVVARGAYNERWIFGSLTTGVYSNADLVANYEGYLFYRGLFEDGVVADRPALVRREGSRTTVTRPFRWRDHVNDYWDEALNPSAFAPALAGFMRQRLPVLCDEYRKAPARFVPRDEAQLTARYAHVKLTPAPEFRLDHVCHAEAEAAALRAVDPDPRAALPGEAGDHPQDPGKN
jgi:hypothetical protein